MTEPTGPPPTTVLVADDEPLTRTGIRLLLGSAPDLDVVAEAADGDEAVALARSHRPDVCVLDLRMPGLDGIATMQAIRAEAADRPIGFLALTTFDDDESVYAALRAGAAGFVLKDSAPRDLLAAVRAVATGDGWIDPAVATQVARAVRRNPEIDGPPPAALGALTPREHDILRFMALGLSNLEISRRLVLSEATVKTHVARVLLKTGSRDRTQAVVLAYRSGLVRPDS